MVQEEMSFKEKVYAGLTHVARCMKDDRVRLITNS